MTPAATGLPDRARALDGAMGAQAHQPLVSFAEDWQEEPAGVAGARARARELGLETTGPLAAAALRLLAAVVGARAAVELGTGTGSSALWLLGGMQPDGVLTTVDNEAEHHRLARAAFSDAGIAAARTRLITGQALEVVPRLAEGGYDLVHVDLPLPTALDLLPQALRVLRPGGVLAVSGVLAGGRVGAASARDPEAIAARALLGTVRADATLVPVLLPLGEGLLALTRTSGEGDRDPAGPEPA